MKTAITLKILERSS